MSFRIRSKSIDAYNQNVDQKATAQIITLILNTN